MPSGQKISFVNIKLHVLRHEIKTKFSGLMLAAGCKDQVIISYIYYVVCTYSYLEYNCMYMQVWPLMQLQKNPQFLSLCD